MPMKRLSNDIQSLFCVSSQINCYKRAIQELVYNALDADATSIAIRVHIVENTIQVIDNGIGVARSDFSLLGQRYATSKCIGLSALKSAPDKYGYRGQALASIIDASQVVKITSRHENSEETWTKCFQKGKEKVSSIPDQRPSKGTTVEMKGFLYNHNILRKLIDPINEINNIKTFLDQLSLVHNNISLSLRDDSKNEILYKLHKNRDVYQTLASVFGVDKTDIQELKVEKKEYKVTALIGKRGTEVNKYHWIYLNGKGVHSSNLHKRVNDNLRKSLHLKIKRNCKSKNNFTEENNSTKDQIPFYFIFITCPYYDYDVNWTLNETMLEFKNWELVNTILDKLIKFYVGDLKFKEEAKTKSNQIEKRESKENVHDTRDQIKTIIEKILGNNPKKPGVSQMQNGVKGKLVKRKRKKKTQNMYLSKDKPPKHNLMKGHSKKIKSLLENDIPHSNHNNLECDLVESHKIPKKKKNPNNVEKSNTFKPLKPAVHNPKNKSSSENVEENTLHVNLDKLPEKIKIRKMSKMKITKPEISRKITNKHNHKGNKIISACKSKETKIKKSKYNVDSLRRKFEENSDSLKVRCNVLARHVDKMSYYKKRNILIKGNVQCSSVINRYKKKKNRKKDDESVGYSYLPKPLSLPKSSTDNRVWDGYNMKSYKSYDLVQTILNTQIDHTVEEGGNNRSAIATIEAISSYLYNYSPSPNIGELNNTEVGLSRLTFESHNNYDEILHESISPRLGCNDKRDQNIHFITKQSKDNFIVPQDMRNYKRKNRTKSRNKLHFKDITPYKNIMTTFNVNHKHDKIHATTESSYSIEFSKSKSLHTDYIPGVNKQYLFNPNSPMYPDTYTLEKEDQYVLHNSNFGSTYTVFSNSLRMIDNIHTSNADFAEKADYCVSQGKCDHNQIESAIDDNDGGVRDTEGLNVVFVSKSQQHEEHDDAILITSNLNAVNLCETELHIEKLEGINTNYERSRIDSLFIDEFSISSLLCDRNVCNQQAANQQNEEICLEEVSRHFDIPNNQEESIAKNMDTVIKNNKIADLPKAGHYDRKNHGNGIRSMDTCGQDLQMENEHNVNNFKFKTRLSFVPKGLSPIFVNCQTRTMCDYNFENDYYEKTLYNNFANEVQMNAEVFKPGVQNLKELTTRDITKVNEKLNRDNASLTFNGESLKQATVMGQVDGKFISAKINGKSRHPLETVEHLVLFDQHAVHERIRLERNLADYLKGDQWKSIELNSISLKLTTDEILYLHNYKNKFEQFGLQWIITNNCTLAISAIPEAILGKNPRQVDIVMRSVKNLITEEIHLMKSQKGCISLYPKSIMDLIFSEACRYAIKFGDKLSKNECVELVNSLSDCKTPFQCAHGRPVMAVLMDIHVQKREYKINTTKIHQFNAKNKPQTN